VTDRLVTDRAVLLPTPIGPAAAIVSEPAGAPRAAVILLQGGGRPGRAGINAVWTRLARRLAESGLLVVRFDYVGEGDATMISKDVRPDLRVPGLSHRGRVDLVVMRAVAAWLRERTGARDLLLAGDCEGGRLAIEFGGEDAGVVGAFLSVPYVRRGFIELQHRRRPVGRVRRWLRRIDSATYHDKVLAALPAMLERGPVWILAGELDGDEALQVKRLLGSRGRGLEVELVPGIALHPVATPEVQEEVSRRLLARIMGAVEQRETARGLPQSRGSILVEEATLADRGSAASPLPARRRERGSPTG
jgi:hypothetical protein